MPSTPLGSLALLATGLLAACGGSSSRPARAPDVPVRATARGPNEVLVEWDTVPGSSYLLLRGGAPIAPPSAAPSWLDLDVASGTTYRYAVEARGADGAVTATGATTVTTPATSARWWVEVVHRGGGFGDTAACTDGAGVLHVVFHDAHAGALVYGRDAGGGLELEEVARGERTGRVADLALDGRGAPHVAFASDGDLLHAERDPQGRWVTRVLFHDSDPQAVAIGVGAGGELHVVHRAGVDNGGLRDSRRAAGSWANAHVPALGPTVGPVDLAVSGGDEVTVLYFAGRPGDMSACLSERRGGVWLTGGLAEVDQPAGAIHRDLQGVAHLVLFRAGRVVVAALGAGALRFEDAGAAGLLPRALDLTTSRFGDLHVVLYGRAQDVVHMLRFDGVWSEEYVDADGDVGEGASIAVAPDGRVDIVYHDPRGGHLRRAQGR